jgi:Ca2+-binding EF-hand superfamily protein
VINDTLKNRLELQFDKLDRDGNGYIEIADYDEAADEVCRSLGADPQSPKAQRFRTEYRSLFNRLVELLETDKDNRISREEFLAGLEGIWDQIAGYDVLKPLSAATFDLVDQNGDGAVSLDEFSKVASAYGVPKSEYEALFRRHDKNKDGDLAANEMHEFIAEYFNQS